MNIQQNIIVLLLCLIPGCYSTIFAQENTGNTARSASVVLNGDTVFTVYSALGPYQPSERANIIQRRIDRILSNEAFQADSLRLFENEVSTDVIYDDQVVLTITEADAVPLGRARQELAGQTLEKLKEVLIREHQSKSITTLLLQVGLTLLELFTILLLIRYVNKLFRFTHRWLVNRRDKIVRGIRFKGYQLLDANRALRVAKFLNNLLRWAVIIVVLYLAIPILFSIFPWTRGLADKLFGYILSPIKAIISSMIAYVPNLFTITVIFFATRYAVRFVKFLAD